LKKCNEVPEKDEKDEGNGGENTDLLTSENWSGWYHSLFRSLTFERKSIENEKWKQREIVGETLCLCFRLLKNDLNLIAFLLCLFIFLCFSSLFPFYFPAASFLYFLLFYFYFSASYFYKVLLTYIHLFF